MISCPSPAQRIARCTTPELLTWLYQHLRLQNLVARFGQNPLPKLAAIVPDGLAPWGVVEWLGIEGLLRYSLLDTVEWLDRSPNTALKGMAMYAGPPRDRAAFVFNEMAPWEADGTLDQYDRIIATTQVAVGSGSDAGGPFVTLPNPAIVADKLAQREKRGYRPLREYKTIWATVDRGDGKRWYNSSPASLWDDPTLPLWGASAFAGDHLDWLADWYGQLKAAGGNPTHFILDFEPNPGWSHYDAVAKLGLTYSDFADQIWYPVMLSVLEAHGVTDADMQTIDTWDRNYDPRVFRFNFVQYQRTAELLTLYVDRCLRPHWPDIRCGDYERCFRAPTFQPQGEALVGDLTPYGWGARVGRFGMKNCYSSHIGKQWSPETGTNVPSPGQPWNGLENDLNVINSRVAGDLQRAFLIDYLGYVGRPWYLSHPDGQRLFEAKCRHAIMGSTEPVTHWTSTTVNVDAAKATLPVLQGALEEVASMCGELGTCRALPGERGLAWGRPCVAQTVETDVAYITRVDYQDATQAPTQHDEWEGDVVDTGDGGFWVRQEK